MGIKFIDVGRYNVNTDRILYVKNSETEEGCVDVALDAGEPLRLDKEESGRLRYRLMLLRNPGHYAPPPPRYDEPRTSRYPPRPRRIRGGALVYTTNS